MRYTIETTPAEDAALTQLAELTGQDEAGVIEGLIEMAAEAVREGML
jgi:hypothetical protein